MTTIRRHSNRNLLRNNLPKDYGQTILSVIRKCCSKNGLRFKKPVANQFDGEEATARIATIAVTSVLKNWKPERGSLASYVHAIAVKELIRFRRAESKLKPIGDLHDSA